MTTLQEARTYVQDMLYMGDADVVHRALCAARRDARSHVGYSDAQEETYGLYFLALSDITGNARYRTSF